MKLSYYPGCTLKNSAKNFEDSALSALKQLDVEVEELCRWNCCGTVYSMTTDDVMHQVAPIRNLARVKEANNSELMTLCAMCYNTLKRANERVKSDPQCLTKINKLMSREKIDYQGDVQTFHLLELLKDRIKFKTISEKVVKPLDGLKIACYYGCLLVRPKEIGFDDIENPSILDDLMSALGATPVDFPHKTECCAAYQTVARADIVAERTYTIVGSAQEHGADIIVVSCPLCAFNLDYRQKEVARMYPDFKHTPILYFTQVMAIALGCSESDLGLGLHYIDPKPALQMKGLV